MYKLKTSRSIEKRLKATSKGKVLRHQSSRSHLLQKKSSKRKQKLRSVKVISQSDYMSLRYKLPYI
uniref:50S ribosomal protein L35 n=1 Tax=Asparagopsis taxiformis TaxID=260499 RepID=A0A1C9CBY0_9FLOR|nr:ribosomal protein L35 [Asparagopsis taxiformis]AOM65898.1 ribosomal protein L35 [Asparagopsis taxiformis]